MPNESVNVRSLFGTKSSDLMLNKSKNALLYYSISTVYEDCRVSRRVKTQLSVLILNERDLALNRGWILCMSRVINNRKSAVCCVNTHVCEKRNSMTFRVELQKCSLSVTNTRIVENDCSKLYGCEGQYDK